LTTYTSSLENAFTFATTAVAVHAVLAHIMALIAARTAYVGYIFIILIASQDAKTNTQNGQN